MREGEIGITALGGVKIGASSTFAENRNTRVLTDVGMEFLPGRRNGPPDLHLIANKRINAILFTHGHLDHTGAAPVAAKQHPEAPIFATAPVKKHMELMLDDSLKIARQEQANPMFSMLDLDMLLARIQEVEYGQWIQISSDTEICFWPMRHTKGASCILVRFADGTVMFSGDFSLQPTPDTPVVPSLPDFKPDILVCEGTNGATVLPPRAENEAKLVARTQEVLAKGGNVICPAFAIGRTGNVALAHARAGIPVRTAGLGRKVMEVDGISHPNISPITSHKEALEVMNKKQQLVVAPAAWLEGGFALGFVRAWIENPDNAILNSGYQHTEKTSYRILNAEPETRVWLADDPRKRENIKNWFVKRAAIENYRTSDHADQNEIVSLVGRVNPRCTFLGHGSRHALKTLKDRLNQENVGGRVRILQRGRTLLTKI